MQFAKIISALSNRRTNRLQPSDWDLEFWENKRESKIVDWRHNRRRWKKTKLGMQHKEGLMRSTINKNQTSAWLRASNPRKTRKQEGNIQGWQRQGIKNKVPSNGTITSSAAKSNRSNSPYTRTARSTKWTFGMRKESLTRLLQKEIG